ncbi:NDP-sugar synthase [Actinomadura madurae]|uniref:Nucleotidyltransferase n=1 Tax=Actinomadura madurae TaxID=1993 RepID=A0A1I5C715_9ACTN|nr:NDP-sugar synthase [Actinomadura madurae]SFN82646.1 nucleotidyltransferase [Actinomadura madurae]SPT50800.1 Glucose-1-phosphate adenylyltransferase [Actinomadura madurae]
MEAILLVGGQGTRLRPLTISTPKPLLPTAGVPLLEHQLTRARNAGVTRIVFATSYRAEMFAEAFGDGARLGMEIVYATENEPLGTAGAIRNASAALTCDDDSPVLVLNGDILSGHDISAQITAHEKGNAAVTLHLTLVDDARRYGSVPTSPDGRVLDFVEKSPNPPTNQVNAGCYIFRRSVIDRIPAGRVVSAEYETFPELLASGEAICGYVEAAYWLDVGTPAAFVRGVTDLVLGTMPSPVVTANEHGVLLIEDAAVAPSALVGGGTAVGAGARIGPDTRVESSVLFDGAVIEQDAHVLRSVIGHGARVCSGAVLEDCVIGDGATVGPGNELLNGARVWPNVALPASAVRFSPE